MSRERSVPHHQARTPARPSVLRAELLRSRRTFTWGAAAGPLVMALWSINLARALTSAGAVEDGGRWAGNVLAWMSFYPDFLALPLGALVGAMAHWREERVREGGTAWRAVDRRRVMAARGTVMAASALVAQVAWLVPVLGYALASGAGWGPVGDYLRFAVLMWVGVTGASLWSMAAARLLGGPVAAGLAPVAALVWTIAGTGASAESDSWVMKPWTWLIRTTLPLLGVHGNSVSLEADAAAWDYPYWPGFLLQSLLTALGAAALMVTANRTRASRVSRRRRPGAHAAAPVSVAARPMLLSPSTSTLSSPPAAAGSGHRGAVAALAPTLPWPLWTALTVPLLGLVAVVRAAYSPSAALTLLALVGLPVAACVVGVTTWVRLRVAWRGLLLRTGPARPTAAALLPGWAFLTAVDLAAWAVAVLGTPQTAGGADGGADTAAVSGAAHVLLSAPFVSLALLVVSHVLTEVFGAAASITVSVLGLLAGVVIAGNEVLASLPLLWLTAPWGWAAAVGVRPERWVEVVALGAVIAAAALVSGAAAGRRVAMRPQ